MNSYLEKLEKQCLDRFLEDEKKCIGDLLDRYLEYKTSKIAIMSQEDFQEKVQHIAEMCHEVNRAWCIKNGDDSQLPWKDAMDWQKESAIKGVLFKLENPYSTPEAQHDAWLKSKIEDGWIYGSVKDAELKKHPCIKPYEYLPEADKIKDKLFQAVVKAMATPHMFTKQSEVVEVKKLRQDIDHIIQRVKNLAPSRETLLSTTKLQEAVMWLGMELKRLNEANPYPSSKDPNTGNVIEPTADGLKL